MLVAKDRIRISSELRFASDITELRGSPFLRRNINRFLDHEDQRVRNRGCARKLGSACPEDSFDFSTWDYPLRQMLDYQRNNSPPVLKVELQSIRPQATSTSTPTRGEKRAKLYDVKCSIELRIEKVHGGDLVYKVQKDARIVGRTDENGLPKYDIKMKDPMHVPIEELSASLADSQQPHTKVFTFAYRTQISINFESKDDCTPFLKRVSSKGFNTADTRDQFTSLCATWKALPKCPRKGENLALVQILGESEVRTRYELEVNMAWSKPQLEPLSSPLQEVQIRSRALQDFQLPTPVSESPTPQNIATTIYCERNGDGVPSSRKLDGYRCGFCQGDSVTTEFTGPDRLQHHLHTMHENLEFDMRTEEMQTGSERHVLVRIDAVAVRSRESSVDSVLSCINVAVPDVDWRRPKQPYQANKHAKSKTWEAKTTKKKGAKIAQTALPKSKPVIKRADPDVPLAINAKKQGSLPRAHQKVYKVPRGAQNVPTIFRTKSRKVVPQEELVDESDLEVDTEWTADGLTHRLQNDDRSGLTHAARQLGIALNQYVSEYHSDENPLTDPHLVKFAVLYAKSHGLVTDPYVLADWLAISRKIVLSPDSRISISDVLFWWNMATKRNKKPVSAGVEHYSKATMLSPPIDKPSTSSNFASSWKTHIKSETDDDHLRGFLTPQGREKPRDSYFRRDSGVQGAYSPSRDKRATRMSIPDTDLDDTMDVSGDMQDLMAIDASGKANVDQEARGLRNTWRRSSWQSLNMVNLKPLRNQQAELGYCVCGQLVDTFVRSVICKNNDCKTKQYHMRCMRLSSRTPGWLCPSCAADERSPEEEL